SQQTYTVFHLLIDFRSSPIYLYLGNSLILDNTTWYNTVFSVCDWQPHQRKIKMGSEALKEAVEDEDQTVDFVTLGMFIIDEIEYPPPRPSLRDIIGGAGTYSALGARLFSPSPTLSRKVGWIVDQGSDFPPSITSLITSWDTGVLLRSTPDRLTTRGWNGYAEGGANRAFKYLTPKKRLAGKDLEGTGLLFAKSFHIISGPNRCRELVNEIIGLRKDAAERGEGPGGEYTRPIFVWEPVPDLCTPDELLNCTNTLPLIDVCSPNHAELAGFMGTSGILADGSPDTGAVEAACEQLLASMPLQSYTLVVRAGKRGCYIAKNGGRKRHPATIKLLPNKMATKKKKTAYAAHGGLSHDTDMFSLFAGLMQDDDGVVAREEIEVDAGLE
ncbi:hypothetical protein GE09DRAFT_1143170, partial [Coniochaeta sp. 2T2.1]